MPRSDRLGALAGAAVGVLIAFTLHSLAAGGPLASPATPPTSSPAPTPSSQVATPLGNVVTFPAQPQARRTQISEQLRSALEPLYEHAFLRPHAAIPPPTAAATAQPSAQATAGPTPKPRDLLEPYFTRAARATVAPDAGVFAPGRGVAITHGRLLYRGIATMSGAKATRALVNVEFRGSGHLSASGTPARLKQAGQLLLLLAEGRWRVSGYDLRLRVDRLGPGASDPQRVAPLAAQRFAL
jgi:hypothetical protein